MAHLQRHHPGFQPTPDFEERVLALASLTARWAKRMNLTGHRDGPSVMRHLILDATALALELPSWRSLVDIGSGAGFPGLPVACLYPDRKITLVEPRERRHHFQKEARRSLGLSQVRTLRGRAEELPPEPHDIALCQAVATPAQAEALLRPWVKDTGWIALPLSREQAASICPRPDAEDRTYVAPDGRERGLRLLSMN